MIKTSPFKTGLALALMAVSLSSCVNLAKRFKFHKDSWAYPTVTKSLIKVEAESYKISEPAKVATVPKDIFSLSAEGQAELIKSLSGKIADPEKYLKSLTAKLSTETASTTKVKVFPRTVSKSIVFSVNRLWTAPGENGERRIMNRIGDRITNLELELELPDDSKLTFNSWDKFITDRISVDLGKVTSSQQWAATASMSATSTAKATDNNKTAYANNTGTKTGKAEIAQTENSSSDTQTGENGSGTEATLALGPSGSVNLTDKYESSLNLLLSRLKLSGTLKPRWMKLRQEGAFDTDLSGNTSVSVDYHYDGKYAKPIFIYKISKYYLNAVPLALTALDIQQHMWLFPDISTTVKAKLRYNFLYRHVRGISKKHIPEARQWVKNIYGEVGYPFKNGPPQIPPLEIELASPKDFKPLTYRIGQFAGQQAYLNWNEAPIDFEKAEEAAAFLEYLVALSRSTKNYGNIQFPNSQKDPKELTIIAYQH